MDFNQGNNNQFNDQYNNQYGNQYGYQMDPYNQPYPMMNVPTEYENLKNEKATKLALASCLTLIGGVVFFFIAAVIAGIAKDENSSVYQLMIYLIMACNLASFILMIIAKATYPKNTFATVMMIIHIIMAVIWVLIILFAILAMAYCMASCAHELNGCSGMGILFGNLLSL